jgi:hypothetical protein
MSWEDRCLQSTASIMGTGSKGRPDGRECSFPPMPDRADSPDPARRTTLPGLVCVQVAIRFAEPADKSQSIVHKDTDLIAGVNLKVYGKAHTISRFCGQKISVSSRYHKNPIELTVSSSLTDGASADPVQIADLCMGKGCGSNPFNLVLSKKAFRKLSGNDLGKGLVDVKWQLSEDSLPAYAPALVPDVNPFASISYDLPSPTKAKKAPRPSTTVTPEAAPSLEEVEEAEPEPTTSTTSVATEVPSSSSEVVLETPKTTKTTQEPVAAPPKVEAPKPTKTKTAVPAPTTTSVAVEVPEATSPAAEPWKNPGSGHGGGKDWIKSTATYYYQEGRAGACGYYAEDSEFVVALSFEYYDSQDFWWVSSSSPVRH